MKYAWAAYRLGGLEDWSAVFTDGLTQEDFRALFGAFLAENYDAVWTVFAETPGGRHAAGMVFAEMVASGRMVIIRDTIWFPWATKRNILTSAANFVNALRSDAVIMSFARQRDVPFFERLSEYRLMRRVGAVHNVYNEPAILFQSSMPEHLRIY